MIPPTVDKLIPEPAAKLLLMSALRDVAVIAPDEDIFEKLALDAIIWVWTFRLDILATLEILISSALMLTEEISGQIIKVPVCPTMPLKKQTFSTSSLCSQCITEA